MESVLSFISKEKIEAPEILYKYRSWENDFHKTVLTERTLFMAPPSSFEDEMEFRNFKRYDLMTDQEVYDKYLKWSHERNKNFTRRQHREHARTWTKRAPFRNPAILKSFQEDQYNQYNRKIGVLSLTANNKKLKMWDYHANHGYGFCVGIDSHLLFNFMGAGAMVNYPPQGLPMIYGNDSWELERWKQVYNKTLNWNWEEEYRVDIFNINDLTDEQRKIVLPPDYFKEIIFGWQISEGTKSNIIESSLHSNLKVIYFQAKLYNEEIEIDPIKL